MISNYEWLVPLADAPLYRYDGRPLIHKGQQVCMPFPQAAAHNWDMIKDQGTVRQYDDAGNPLSAEEIRREIRERITSSLLGDVSPAYLYFFNPIELLIISDDEDLLWMQRSHRGASEGMINHFAGGFPKVVKNRQGFFEAEPKKVTALRETWEELGIEILNAVDLNCNTYDNTITPFALKRKDGGTYPGFVPEIMQRFGYHWRASTLEILSKLKTGSDSVGMTITRLPALEAMLRGDRDVKHQFVPNSIPSVQKFIDTSMQDGKLQLSLVRKKLLDSAPMTNEERAQTGVFDLSRIMPATAGADVFYPANYASGLAAFRAAGIHLSNFASQHLDKFRYESTQKILRPGFAMGSRLQLSLAPQYT